MRCPGHHQAQSPFCRWRPRSQSAPRRGLRLSAESHVTASGAGGVANQCPSPTLRRNTRSFARTHGEAITNAPRGVACSRKRSMPDGASRQMGASRSPALFSVGPSTGAVGGRLDGRRGAVLGHARPWSVRSRIRDACADARFLRRWANAHACIGVDDRGCRVTWQCRGLGSDFDRGGRCDARADGRCSHAHGPCRRRRDGS